MNQKTKSGLKIISNNRKARFNFFLKDFFEAGIVLKGSEVKSLRKGKVNISESYAYDNNGELYLINSHFRSIIICWVIKYNILLIVPPSKTKKRII